MHAFVPATDGKLSLRPLHSLPLSTNSCRARPRSSTIRITPTAASNRSPWPLPRLLQTLWFYSPVGRMMRGGDGKAYNPGAEVRAQRFKSGKQSATGKILVTGASGGTGRRVVRDLLASSIPVRALTRSYERLESALNDVGVNLKEEEEKGTIEVFVSDLFNIREEMFTDVIGVASCTGTRVGPTDDPDRSKYFQGIKFYPPVVQDNTPENVEYIGVKNLLSSAKKHFEQNSNEEELTVLAFDDPDRVRAQWGAVDDVVMGGVSKSNVRVNDGKLVFGGFVSTDNSGGFASARTVDFSTPIDLRGYDGISFRCKGDGQSYKMILRCEQKWDGIGHCFTFPTKANEWTEVRIPFDQCIPVFRAKTVKDGTSIDPSKIFAFQIMLSKFEYDGNLNPNFNAGPFELMFDSIRAYKGEAKAITPKIVYTGSAAVTRVFRKAEFEKLPPIVELNEKLGRLLEWKFAGEDVIRNSGLPYVIFRFCALTVNKAVGVDELRFEQGDNIVGQISRDDVSKLIVSAFSNPALVNVTTEVAQRPEEVPQYGEANPRLEKLEKDSNERAFAAYPFVPVEAKV